MIMQNNPDKIFKSEEMASLLYVSARTFRNRFKDAFHKSFTQYQMEAKLEKVCLILKTYPEMQIKEIAANFGFYDEFHLSKVFKRYYGVSPSQYRKDSTAKEQ
ncbi:MAG: helix-turn-helix domain-containing protein [Eubacteriales bacterium]